ncbi:hypothetical protein [Streptomyces sp. NPDC058953]|uniref:hypothetical protein n=1 Tax=unclassified Streptomyces TaxID=2593676 RepID=UPI0036AE7FB2
MSDLDKWEDGTPGRPRTYGRASDSAQVYQSGADQYVTHLHITVAARSEAAHDARDRADVVVQGLTHAVGELKARCEELEEKARRAKAEGRAEAHAEFTERLRNAELSVIKAQRTMRQAEEERAKAEALLARARQELAKHRRAADRDEPDTPRAALVGPSPADREADQFSDLLERAEAELGSVREELRQLGEEINGRDHARAAERTIEGEWTSSPDPSPPPTAAPSPARPSATPPKRQRPGPPRRSLIGLVWLLCTLPPWIPVLVITANRAAFGSDASLWGVLPFAFFTVLGGAVLLLLALLLAGTAAMDMLNRKSEEGPGITAFLLTVVASAIFLLSAFFTPLTWPGPAGAWGRGLASLVGLA